MHQVQIEIVELQILERLLACRDDVLRCMLVVPEFGRDPQFIAAQTGLHALVQCLADQVLIQVDRRAIDVPVAHFDGAAYCLRDGLQWEPVGRKRAQTEGRQFRARPDNPHGDARRIDAVRGRDK